MTDDPLLMARLALALIDRLDAASPGLPPDVGLAADVGVAPLGRVVLVSSARAGEGKSFIAGLLHAALSAQQAYAGRVALVGANLLNGRSASDHRPPAGGTALLFQPAAVREALTLLRRHHALTLVDGGTLADCGALAREADAVLLVVDASRTPRRSIEGALATARIDAGRFAGVVLNRREAGLPRWLGAD